MIGVLIVLGAHFIWLSSGHLGITPILNCEAAKTCNHTFIAVCGQSQYTLGNRLFMDECDMYEYNCKYQAEYVKVEGNLCWHECTHDDPLHTPGPKTATCAMAATHPQTPGITTNQPTTHSTTAEQPTTTTTTTGAPGSVRMGQTSTPGWYRPTVVLKKKKVFKNGKMRVKVIKKFLSTKISKFKEKPDSDFLQ
ncbi:uncharacterized protein LOC142982403 [Anticarsia gemmatalis]|uniref:uncharacterized protein LOC142982403 n=1 Tax=Anticarsia gemmatalis TaxID=129554 RepID=UPI003F76698B